MRKKSVSGSRSVSKWNQRSERSTSTTKAVASTKSLQHPKHRITHRQQQERINTVLRVRPDRSREKQYRSNQRERRRHRITPRSIRSRFIGLAMPHHEERDKREDVVNHKEESEHRNHGLEFLAEDYEQQRHERAQKQGHSRSAALINYSRSFHKQTITPHREHDARPHQVQRVDAAQHRHDRETTKDRVAVTAKDHRRCFARGEFLSSDLRYRQDV